MTRFVYLLGYKLYSVSSEIRSGLIFIFLNQLLTNYIILVELDLIIVTISHSRELYCGI